jgi:AraC family transcriptional regulator of adaptative response / DNA-3-methyladenine glycosylase II
MSQGSGGRVMSQGSGGRGMLQRGGRGLLQRGRRGLVSGHAADDGTVDAVIVESVRLPFQPPFAADAMLEFLRNRCVPGVERVDGRTYARTLRLPSGTGIVELTLPAPGEAAEVGAIFRLDVAADLAAAEASCRRLLDLDADPETIDRAVSADPALTASVRELPGLRVPGAVDGAETLVRAMLGQQISVAGARTAAARLTLAANEMLPVPADGLTHLFPSPAAIAALGPAAIAGPRRRAQAITDAAASIARGDLQIDGRDTTALTAQLISLPGIGPWTAAYVAMRALRDHDVLLIGDLVLRNGAAALGLPMDAPSLLRHADAWRPYRSYAAMHLWRAAPARSPRRPHTEAARSITG